MLKVFMGKHAENVQHFAAWDIPGRPFVKLMLVVMKCVTTFEEDQTELDLHLYRAAFFTECIW